MVALWGPLLFPFSLNDPLLKRLITAIFVFAASFFYTALGHPLPNLPDDGLSGVGNFEIESLSLARTHFGTFWIYKGTLREFRPVNHPTTGYAHAIPCRISLPNQKEMDPPPADCAYQIKGCLKETSPFNYSFIPAKSSPWLPIKHSWCSAKIRHETKRRVAHYIHQHVKDQNSASFLAGLATGEFDNTLLSHEFGRFGLRHIMAISGFHFTIIALVLSMLCRLILCKKRSSILLLFLLTSYFIFLGCSPSIFRAWIAITIAFIGHLLEKQSNALNSLGMALIIMLAFDPWMPMRIGFQFSFAVTTAILLLHPGCSLAIQTLFPKRPLSLAVKMNSFTQHGYFMISLFRQSLALTLAVNLVSLPMSLYYFHKFPLLGLVYNLFFPFMVSLSMLFLILGTLFSFPFPFIGEGIHAFNSLYTKFILNFIYNMPATVDVTLYLEQFPGWILSLYLSAVLYVGIGIQGYLHKRKEEAFAFEFL